MKSKHSWAVAGSMVETEMARKVQREVRATRQEKVVRPVLGRESVVTTGFNKVPTVLLMNRQKHSLTTTYQNNPLR